MKVLFLSVSRFLHPWYDDFLAAIDGRYPVDLYDPDKPMLDQFQGVEVVVDYGGMVGTPEMIDVGLAAGVKLWQILTTGVDHVDVACFLEKGMPIANTPGPFSATALAEHALFLMLCVAKNFRICETNVRSEIFYEPMNEELDGKTLSLIGFGASGRELARRAWPLGMRILAIDAIDVPQAILDELRVDFFGDRTQLDRVVTEADYLSLHTPLTTATRNMIDRRVLGLMKPTSVLINVARGAIVDELALVETLRSRRIRGAGIDVFQQEPISPAHPLLQLDNVIATPHIAGETVNTSRRRGQAAAGNVVRVAEGLPPLYQIKSVD